jgi:hypothetical protein
MNPEAPTAPRFFVLEEGVIGSRYDTDVDQLEPVNLGDGARCPKCGYPIGMLTWLPPHRAGLLLHGEELGDYMEVAGEDLLLSERFVQAFREEGFTGLEGFHPVEVVRVIRERRGPSPSHIPRYFLATVCFSRVAVDLKRSRIRYDEPPSCEECRASGLEATYGFTLEADLWQGEDIFQPRGLPGVWTVSERFASFITRHGFTNMRLTPCEEYVWNPLGPDPLPHTKTASA